MERKAMEELIKWKNKKDRKPLLLYGARQVGKTYLVNDFGKRYYKNIIYVNFEANKMLNNLFNDNIEPNYIIKNLEIIYNTIISKDETLIFFDEIQENPRALTSLKYFYEQAPSYHIIGAGSLLGVHLNKNNYSFPVGKVEFLTIYPLSFEEFLINVDKTNLKKEIEECFKNNQKMNELNHSQALKLYYDYLQIGGMPEVVNKYLESNSVVLAQDIKQQIINSYRSDITKYTSTTDGNKIIAAYDSIPNQLAKDNKKFQYKVIKKGATSAIFGEAINWLTNAGIVLKCVKLSESIGIPLKMYEQIESFKLYLNDTGLLINLSDFPIYFINNENMANPLMMGMITENYVASNLKYNNFNLYYWQNDGTCEVDFILQSKKGLIVPLEVKASNNTKSRSLTQFMQINKSKYGIRVSTKNFGFENKIKSIPLYAIFCLNEDSLDN